MIINWLLNKADRNTEDSECTWEFLILCVLFIASFVITAYELYLGNILVLPFAISVLVVSECFFWLERPKPKRNQNKMEFTLERKLINAIDAFVINGCVFEIVLFRDGIINFFLGIYSLTILAIMWLCASALGIVGLYGLLWLNSLKYRNVKYPKNHTKRIKILKEQWKRKPVKKKGVQKNGKK